MKFLACTILVAALALTGAEALAQDSAPIAATAAYSAGLCVLLDDQGQVIDARIAQTSGDASLDDHAVSLARRLQWIAPFPKAGWLGVRIVLSETALAAAPKGSMPHCSAASGAAHADAV